MSVKILAAPDLDQDRGDSLLLALHTQNDWIIRTVERVKFVDHNTVRRLVIRHFRLPKYEEARPLVEIGNPSGGGTQRCMLPVFALKKGVFISCDLRDGSDRKIALRPIEERWELTYQALFSLLLRADPAAAGDERLRERVWDLIKTTWRRADDSFRALLAYGQQLESTLPAVATVIDSEDFRDLAEYLSRNYLVFADVELTPQRDHMISYMFDERFADRISEFREAGMQLGNPLVEKKEKGIRYRKQLGLRPHTYLHPWPISGAGSSHLEIQAPDGVDLGRRELKLPQRRHVLKHRGTSARYARFLAPRSASGGEGFAKLEIHPGSGVMRTAGPVIGALFAFLLFVVALAHIKPGLAATLLLILPSLSSLVAARPGEHPYVTRVVRGVRYMTLFPIVFSALAVAILAGGLPRWWLYLLVIVSISFTAILFVGSRRLKVRSARADLIKEDLTRVA
jgi:hypothetical protein